MNHDWKNDLLADAQRVAVRNVRIELQKQVHVLAENQFCRHPLRLEYLDERVSGANDIGHFLIRARRRRRPGKGNGDAGGGEDFGEVKNLTRGELVDVRDMRVQGLDAWQGPVYLRGGIALCFQDLEEPFALLDDVLLSGLRVHGNVFFKEKAQRFF